MNNLTNKIVKTITNTIKSVKAIITSPKTKRVMMKIITHLWLVLSVAVVLTPVLWMLVASLTPGKSLANIGLLPDFGNMSAEHYVELFTKRSTSGLFLPDYVGSFFRTLSIAILNTILVVIVSVLTGYALTRFRFKGKKQILLGMMGIQMFPSFMAMLAFFLLFKRFDLLNQPLALVFIYGTGAIPYNVFIYRGFMRNIPKSLDEAADIDGASNIQKLTKIIIPLSMPIIGFLAVNAFMAPWLDYILPSVLLTDPDKITVAIWLFRTTDPLRPHYYNPLTFMAGALLLAIPIMIVNIFMQKYIVYGLTAGAEKG
ncbi:sugar ABC transporter permease [Haloplasma contractile]|uniref:MalG type permease protein n=1 Tax=Haloplasma contractile SSD-17B TaxID=1033810 RepID=U2EDU6_9MOLU|nr:ABC transporter permease subunit [Haloplasma contractile]ERJ13163.1 Putative malG type permease protein [Haloplasma contractile SSD-17B]